MRRITRIIFAGVLLIGLGAGPATRPASEPAMEVSGPQEAFKAFLADMSLGKSDEIAPLCLARDEDSKLVVADFARIASAIGQLRQSMTRKFGAKSVDGIVSRLLPMGEDVDEAKLTVRGDSAVLEGGNFLDTVRLARVQGQWKLDISALLQAGDLPANSDAYLSAMALAVRRTVEDIDAGKFDSPEMAGEVLQIRQSKINDENPTTFPSDFPSTNPSPTTAP